MNDKEREVNSLLVKSGSSNLSRSAFMSQDAFTTRIWTDAALKPHLNDEYVLLPEKYAKSEAAKVTKTKNYYLNFTFSFEFYFFYFSKKGKLFAKRKPRIPIFNHKPRVAH